MALRVSKEEAKRLQEKANKRVVQHTLEGEAEEVKEKKPRKNIEAQLQAALFFQRDCVMLAHPTRWPALAFVAATLNGVYIPPALKEQIKAQGLTAGVLDVLCFNAYDGQDGHFCGLAIDMKTPKTGHPSADQLRWAKHLVENGWCVYFCESAVEAWWCLCAYLGIYGKDHWAVELQAQERTILALAAAT